MRNEIDEMERKEREYNLNRIAEQERKRREKIENYNDGKMNPELAKQLNQRKSRLRRFKDWMHKAQNTPETPKPEPTSDAVILKRNAVQHSLKEDNPPEPTGINLWENNNEQK